MSPVRHRLVVLVAALLLSAIGASSAAAAPTVDPRGSWQLSLGYAISITTFDCSSGAYSGFSSANGQSWPESGTVSGNHLVGTAGPYTTLPSYTAYWDLTFDTSDHGTGTWSSNHSQNGSLTATRKTGPAFVDRCPGIDYSGGPITGGSDPDPTTPTPTPGPTDGKHGTAMQVMCTYVVATSQDTCTATVGDAAQQPTAPTGTVTFGATEGTLFGDTCTLSTSPSAPSTGSCSVQYQRPFGSTKFPDVSGVYSGDATHSASTASTQFLILGGPPSFTSQYPNQVDFQTEVEADGSRVDSCATAGSKGTAKATKSQIAAQLGATLGARAARLQAPAPPLDKQLEELAEKLRQMDDKQTQATIPAMEKVLAKARQQMEANKAEYDRRVAAGEKSKELQRLKQEVEGVNAAVTSISQALHGQCSIVIGNLKGVTTAAAARAGSGSSASIATSARAAAGTSAKTKGKRTATLLGKFTVKSAKAGHLPVSLKLSKSALRKLAKGKKPVTVYVRVITVSPSGLVAKGWPRMTIVPIKISRDGKIVP